MSPLSAETPRGALVRALHAAACIGALAALSYAAHTPFLYPPLGATALLLVTVPTKPVSSTRNVVFGHTIAAAAGWSSLWALGVNGQQMGLAIGCDAPHVFSATLALALTTFLLLTLKIDHPPAGATTVIVGIGLLPHAWQVPMACASALLISLEARLLQRLSGQTLPWWNAPSEATRIERAADLAAADEASAS